MLPPSSFSPPSLSRAGQRTLAPHGKVGRSHTGSPFFATYGSRAKLRFLANLRVPPSHPPDCRGPAYVLRAPLGSEHGLPRTHGRPRPASPGRSGHPRVTGGPPPAGPWRRGAAAAPALPRLRPQRSAAEPEPRRAAAARAPSSLPTAAGGRGPPSPGALTATPGLGGAEGRGERGSGGGR